MAARCSSNNASSFKVLHVIPNLGYIPIVLTSNLAKGIGGLAILALDLAVYLRWTWRPRLERHFPA